MKLMIKFFPFLFLIYWSAAYASDLSHPPTFEQIIKSNHSHSDIVEALKYNDEDIRYLMRQNDIKHIIAIASQLERAESLKYMSEHLPAIKNDPLGLSLFISRSFIGEDVSKMLVIEELGKEFIKIAPQNAYPYLLMANYYTKTDKATDCLDYTKQAVNATAFNNYQKEINDNSIQASILLGYSKLAAQFHANEIKHGMFHWLIYNHLSDYLLNNQDNKEVIKLCKSIGTVIKANSTFILGELTAIGIIQKALKQQHDKNAETELNAIGVREKQIKSFVMRSLDVNFNTYEISEERLEQYFTEIYEYSEQYAKNQILKEYSLSH